MRPIDADKLIAKIKEFEADATLEELDFLEGVVVLVNTQPTVETEETEALKAELAERTAALEEMETVAFAIVRNSAVLPVGLSLKKTQKEITEKTFETIEETKKMIDFPKMRECMNLGRKK